MKVLADTCIWSEVFRRHRREKENPHIAELLELIRENRILMIGPIRQEILSGIRDLDLFLRLRERLRSFPDAALIPEDYELAAEIFNRCRAAGAQGSNTDFLICAVAQRFGAAVFTTDGDYRHFAKHTPVLFHIPTRKSWKSNP